MSLPSPLLVVTDRHGSDRPLVETVRAVLDGGARWIWFRDRDLDAAARHDLAAELLALVREAGGRLGVGGDAALAATIGADGVHLGGSVPQDRALTHSAPPEVPAQFAGSRRLEGPLQGSQGDPEPRFEGHPSRCQLGMGTRVGEVRSTEAVSIPGRVAAARRLLVGDRLVGLSIHDVAECRAAARAGSDYVTLSPIFATASKPGYGPALGLAALRTATVVGIPVVALGGIGPEEARACRAAGAAGVAVMGGLMRAPDPATRTRILLDALG